MKDQKYFDVFPPIFYNNYKCINIMQRAAFLNSVYNNPFVYYPYETREGDRPDTIAYDYYGDQYSSWIVYYGNKIVDPYYGWYLTGDEFRKHIISKYGTIANSQLRTAFYRIDWSDNEERIEPSFFENTLADELKKYWTAEFAPNGKIIAYRRAPLDHITNTNMILKLNITKNNSKNFSANDYVKLKLATEEVGHFEVLTASNTELVVQHVYAEHESFSLAVDEFEINTPNVTFFVVGTDNTANANVTSYTLLQRNISSVETGYWSPVSWYEYEDEKNAKNKNIYLLDSKYHYLIKEELNEVMKK